ncbi:hypothetical protein D3C73_1298970 [compost metagenome]
MVRDLFEPLVRDAAATGDVAQEGNDVVLAFRTAEGCEQYGVVLFGFLASTLSDGVRFSGDNKLGHARTSAISAAVTRRPV